MSQMHPRTTRAPMTRRVFALAAIVCACLALLLGIASPSMAQSPPAEEPRLNAPSSPAPSDPLTPETREKMRRRIVADVRVVGNSHTKEFQVFDKIKTRRDYELDDEQVQKDVRSLYATGRFRNIIPHIKDTKDGVIVTYELFERPYIQYIVYHGNRDISEKKLGKEHGMKVGDALNAFNVQEGRRKLEELYRHNGHPKADVLIREGDKPQDKGVVYVINEGPRQRIAHVEFMGNRVVSAARLETFIQSTPGYFSYASPYFASKFDRQKLEQDVETLTKYYRALGYFSARIGREVVADDGGNWVTIKFIIDEGPRYVIRSIQIEGSTKFEADKLLAFLKLKKGDYFSQDFMERDRTLLTDLYGTQGHAFADIQADPRLLEQPGELDLVYRVTEGAVFHVGEINVHIAGEFPHTKETVILARANIRHGDLLDAREIRNWERRLKASQLFVTNPQEGDLPRIEIREPRLSVESLAESPPRGGTIRGQSPEEKRPAATPPLFRSPESPLAHSQRLAREQQDQESRYGRSIYSWDSPRETMYRTPRIPASPPRGFHPQAPSSAPR